MQRKTLGPEFFDRSTLVVARELVGKYLVRMMPDPSSELGAKPVGFMITETEAYHGTKDLACHARSGRTARNAPMWGRPGHAYVYFTYGMHWMLNLVAGPEGFPSAVLIRALQFDKSVVRQGVALPVVLNGPGKLTKFLQIDKSLNGRPLSKKSGLWVEDRGVRIDPRHIKRTPRIGIAYAGEYVHKPWRFVFMPPALQQRRSRRAGP